MAKVLQRVLCFSGIEALGPESFHPSVPDIGQIMFDLKTNIQDFAFTRHLTRLSEAGLILPHADI